MTKKTEEKIDLSNLNETELAELIANASKIKEELHSKNFPENLAKIREYISNLGMNLQEVVENLIDKPTKKIYTKGAGTPTPKGEVIFEYKDYKKVGLKGKPKWAGDLKNEISKEEALKHSIGEDGRTFIDRIYA